MKRCPQCEFIYNDDQNLCDMDGRGLVYDDALATLPYSSFPANDLQVTKSRTRVFTVPALAGLVLAALICLGYYAAPRLIAQPETRRSSESQKLQNSPAPETAPTVIEPSKPTTKPAESPDPSKPIGDSSDQAEPVSPVQRNPSTAALVEKPDERLTISRRSPRLRRIPPLPRLPPAKVAQENPTVRAREHRAEVAGMNQKKESGVRSFLKKTGRILKKPFKL